MATTSEDGELPAATPESPASTDVEPLRFELAPSADVADIRGRLREAQRELEERLERGIPAHALVKQRSDLIDRVLGSAWRRHGLASHPGVALVAVGGYGRGELHPYSDVDLMILTREDAGDRGPALQSFVTFLWDIGLEVGHSVRSVPDCEREAGRDITIATNLMESRLIDGSRELYLAMRAATGPDRIWSGREFFEAKLAEQLHRHHRFHDTAYNLEPNVKEGPGGLRDIQMVGWVAKRHFGADTLHELVTHEFLTESEYQSLTEGQNFLWQVRFTLHALTGRREDRLLFDYQRRIASRFGYRDDDANLAVEKFMKRYYRNIMELSRLNEMLLELFQEAILLADAPREVTPINRRFQAVNGFLEACNERVFRRYPFALLETFLLLQQRPELKGVRASTIRLIRDHRYLIDEKFRRDIRARSLFLEILKQPRGITHELRRMNRYGVLGAYLPVFGAVVGQMQYDLFHTYTVDEHSLFVVSNLRGFAVGNDTDGFALGVEIFQRLPKPHLLYIAGMFHDIAKGRGGDHSELGAENALQFCRDHGLGQYDARLVAWLVRHHLVMSVTAQRRDISDPDVVAEFAETIGDRTHLDYLVLLTVADIAGTNPALWNDWKGALLRDLYEATNRALRRGLEKPIDRAELIAETRAEACERLGNIPEIVARANRLWDGLGDDYFTRSSPGEIAWHTRAILNADAEAFPLVLVRAGRGGTEIFVYAPDREFFFAASTSVLGRLGLNIVDARIITADSGMTLDSYVVLELDGEPVTDARREAEIVATLREALKNPHSVRRTDNRLPRRQLRHFPIPTEVSFSTDARNDRTVMEVIASDRPGLLASIGWALADAKARLQNAKIVTFGERAEDIFYVTDSRNRPLDPARYDEIASRVRESIDASK